MYVYQPYHLEHMVHYQGRILTYVLSTRLIYADFSGTETLAPILHTGNNEQFTTCYCTDFEWELHISGSVINIISPVYLIFGSLIQRQAFVIVQSL